MRCPAGEMSGRLHKDLVDYIRMESSYLGKSPDCIAEHKATPMSRESYRLKQSKQGGATLDPPR